MTKEELKSKLEQLLSIIDNQNSILDDFNNIGIDMYDSDLKENSNKLVSMMFSEICNGEKDKIEALEWFIYEYRDNLIGEGKKMCKENACAWDKYGNPIDYDIDSLCERFCNEWKNEKTKCANVKQSDTHFDNDDLNPIENLVTINVDEFIQHLLDKSGFEDMQSIEKEGIKCALENGDFDSLVNYIEKYVIKTRRCSSNQQFK